MLPTTIAGPPVTARNALNLDVAWACVRALSESAATLPLHVYRRTAQGRVRADDTLAARVLQRPAQGTTQANFIAQLMVHLALWGEAFCGVYRSASGTIEQLGLFAPDRVAVDVLGGMPTYGITTDDGRYLVLTTSDVIHVRGISLDGIRGLSPVGQQRDALGHANVLARHGAKTMARGGAPAGVLYVEDGPNADEQMQLLAEAWESRHGGAENAGRVALLTGAVKFEPVSMPLADQQYLGQIEASAASVCRIFRVPPYMVAVSVGDSLTYANLTDQLRAFVTHSLRPWLVFIEQALAASVLFTEPNTYPQFSLDALLRGSPAERAAFYTAGLNPDTGWLRRDEARELEDLPAEPQEATADV